MPDMAVGLYNKVIAYDHHTRQCWLIVQHSNKSNATLIFDQVINTIRPAQALSPYHPPAVTWRSQCSKNDYEAQVQKIIDYILDGDIFQANLSRQLIAPRPDGFHPYAHYKHLRRVSPAPFAAYMNLGDVQILSASPERFLSASHTGTITTKPIKGTAQRFDNDHQADTRAALALQNNEKERAENIMIADLLRNDLSKSCQADSIQTPHICEIESFAQVHHLVTTITGQLDEGKTPLDVLRDCFPGGSITGAPKIRAMDIIDELEGQRRHAYCGAMVMIGADGFMDSNILIRTLTINNDTLRFNVGGGITALSDPATEYQETVDKAQGILQSFAPEAKQKKAL